ncbi:MAG: DUF1778 domain-containing protein [Pseudonocardia sp.]
MNTTARDDRLQVRVDATSKRRLEEAATEVGLSLSAFVLQAAQQHAAQVLSDRALIRLSPDAAAAFDQALSQPAQANERLAAALKRPTKLTWLD